MIQPFMINTELEALNRDYRSQTLPTSFLLLESALSFSYFSLYYTSSILLRSFNISSKQNVGQHFIETQFLSLLTKIQSHITTNELYFLFSAEETINIDLNFRIDKNVKPEYREMTTDISVFAVLDTIEKDIISFLIMHDRTIANKVIKQIQQVINELNNPFSVSNKTILDQICKGSGTPTASEIELLSEPTKLVKLGEVTYKDTVIDLTAILGRLTSLNDYLRLKVEHIKRK
jgi:hypothetical protein